MLVIMNNNSSYFLVKPIGLESLKRLLKNDPKIFSEYFDFLLDCYKRGDMQIKITIASIFSIYLGKENAEETVNTIVKDLSTIAQKAHVLEVSDKLIEHIIQICSKNNYGNISDPEWFLMDVMLKIIPLIRTSDTAKLVLDTLIVSNV